MVKGEFVEFVKKFGFRWGFVFDLDGIEESLVERGDG